MKLSLRSYRKRTFIYKICKLIFIPLGLFAHKSWCLPLALIFCQVLSPCLVCLVQILCLFSSRIPGRGVPHTIHGSTLLVLGSRLQWQAVHCGAGLCHDTDNGFSGTRHKVSWTCCSTRGRSWYFYPWCAFFLLLARVSIAIHVSFSISVLQIAWNPCLHTTFSTFRILRPLYGIFLGERSLNFQEIVYLLLFWCSFPVCLIAELSLVR